MADTYLEKKPGFVGFAPRRPLVANALNSLSRLKISSSSRDIKKGHMLYHTANNTLDRVAVQGTNEVQTITITGTPTGGSFTVTSAITGYSRIATGNDFAGTTVAISYAATAAVVQAALETVLGVGNVTCAGGPFPGTAVTVTFAGELEATNVAALSTTDSLTGGTTPASAVTTTTAGVNGIVTTSTLVLGFSEMNDVNPLSAWPRSFGMAPLNLDGPYGFSSKPILVHPDYPGEIYQGALWPTETVAASMVGTSYSVGWSPTNECHYVRTGDTSNALVKVIGIPDGELGKVGGIVDFLIVDGVSYFH